MVKTRIITAILLAVSIYQNVKSQQISLNVGMLIPRTTTGYENVINFNISAGAVVYAIEHAKELKIYDPSVINITFSRYFSECEESLTAGFMSELIRKHKSSIVLGPVCPHTSHIAGALSTYTKTPTFLWGPTAPGDFYKNNNKYPLTMAFAGTAKGIYVALSNVMAQFEWKECAFLYTESGNPMTSVCRYFASTFKAQSKIGNEINPVYFRKVVDTSPTGFRELLFPLKARARIVISCLETSTDRRNYMLAAIDLQMVSTDYVHLFTQVTSIGFGNPPFWVGNDGRDEEIKEASKTIILIDKLLNISTGKTELLKEIADHIYGWPFYCADCPKNRTASNLSIYLGDAMLAYLLALNKTYTKYGNVSQLRNSHAIMEFFYSYIPDMPSISSSTYMLDRGLRAATYQLITLNSSGQPNTWATIMSVVDRGNRYVANYQNESATLWALRDGIRPVSVPVCGFSNEKCLKSPIYYTIILVCCVVGFFLIIALLGLIVYLFQRQQTKRLNALWELPFTSLQTLEQRENIRSMRSSQSTLSAISIKTTAASRKTDRTTFFYYNNVCTVVMARNYPYYGKWTAAEEEEFRRMRALDHPNLNKFLGVSISGSIAYMIWAYNERGSLMEVINAHDYQMDSVIMIGMMKNIIEAIYYLHNSSFKQHGSVNVYRCVVGDRFNIRLQCYGLSGIKQRQYRNLKENTGLFVAPEHLSTQQNLVGSQAGDIYSMAIVFSVILTLKPAYNCPEDDERKAASIIRSVAKGKYPPVRPKLEIDPILGIKPELITLIQNMWSEHPNDRPSIETVREVMQKRISTSKSSNLMDYMFALMESNAGELEKQVKQQTFELIEEKKKADILLYKIMPKAAADSLKLGQTVSPEVYDSATVLFSDIVSFTTLASKSTPFQIIDFLNSVYTLADSIIDKYDVYKVETIGDGMHVVSGVPNRNGNNHVREIANMAIDFQRAVKTLKMAHLPDKQIQMRIGIHSGSCVAGIVGSINPRYVVFGDTVNMSAKMEVSGRAGRIHITGETKDLLLTHFPDKYKIVDRGESLVKGIGARYTYWLVPPEEINGFEA